MSTSMDIECPDCGDVNSVEVDSIDELTKSFWLSLECEACGSPLFDEEDYTDEPPVFVTTPPSITSAPTFQEPDRHQPAQGQSRLGKDIHTGRYVDVPQASRRQGLYITGIQGTGKSVLIENLIIQDIKQNMGVCLLDPHGDLTQAVLSRLPEHREKDVIYLDMNNYRYPFGVNLFQCPDLTDLMEVQKTIDQVIHVFEKLLGVSHETPLILEYLQNCTHTLIANPGYTMADIPLLLQDGACRRKLVANVTDLDVQLFWRLHEQKKPADQNYDISSTLRRVREFLKPLSRPIVGQSTSTIDLRQVMDEGKILLVKLDTTLESITELIGSLMIALFLNAAKSRADLPVQKRRQFNLYADEFQRFATEDYVTLIEEARKFGIGITIAHQNGSQLETSLKERARSVANLVVFKVNSKDADELAGEFDITPQEAWEEEIEAEWVEIVTPQRHERIEEQVEIEVEDDVKAIINNPVEYLLSVRSAHSSERVNEIIQNSLKKLEEKLKLGSFETKRKIQKLFKLLNDLLIQVMRGNIKTNSYLFNDKVLQIARAYDPSDVWERPEWDDLLFSLFENASYYRENIIKMYEQDITILELKRNNEYEECKAIIETCGTRQYINNLIEKFVTLIEAVRDLCVELHESPITISTGERKMVKRIQPHITYLTHESEKITHPRKTILHPQRTYADVHNEVASELTNLPVFTARVKIATDNGSEEHTIKTLDPKQDRDRPLYGQALQERIDRIKKQNIQDGYVRDRTTVEEEIRTRQGQCSQPPEAEPPVSRRPNR